MSQHKKGDVWISRAKEDRRWYAWILGLDGVTRHGPFASKGAAYRDARSEDGEPLFHSEDARREEPQR